MTDRDYAELSALYAEESGLSARVCEALLRHDIEPTRTLRDRVDRIGWTAAQDRILASIRSTTNQQAAEFKAAA